MHAEYVVFEDYRHRMSCISPVVQHLQHGIQEANACQDIHLLTTEQACNSTGKT